MAWYWIMRWALNKAYRQTVISPSIDAATGKPRDWADLAARLGYADQAHFIRDFKRFVGQSPSRYAATAAG